MPWDIPAPIKTISTPITTKPALSATSTNMFENLNFSKPQTSDPFPPMNPTPPTQSMNMFDPSPAISNTPGSLANMKDDPFADLGIESS